MKGEKRCFLDEAEFLGAQSPHAYDCSKYGMKYERIRETKIAPVKEKKKE